MPADLLRRSEGIAHFWRQPLKTGRATLCGAHYQFNLRLLGPTYFAWDYSVVSQLRLVVSAGSPRCFQPAFASPASGLLSEIYRPSINLTQTRLRFVALNR